MHTLTIPSSRPRAGASECRFDRKRETANRLLRSPSSILYLKSEEERRNLANCFVHFVISVAPRSPSSFRRRTITVSCHMENGRANRGHGCRSVNCPQTPSKIGFSQIWKYPFPQDTSQTDTSACVTLPCRRSSLPKFRSQTQKQKPLLLVVVRES